MGKTLVGKNKCNLVLSSSVLQNVVHERFHIFAKQREDVFNE